MAHLPITAGKSQEAFNAFLEGALKEPADLTGAAFPTGRYKMLALAGGIRCHECSFGPDTILLVRGDLDLSHSRFSGVITIRTQASKADMRVLVNGAAFEGLVDISSTGEPTRTFFDFSHAEFGQKVVVSGIHFSSPLSFDGARFAEPPEFPGCELPQQTTFAGARFEQDAFGAPNEGLFRAIRVGFAAHRNRELEGRFFAYEKRCHRGSLPWWPSGFARFLSWLYDTTSRYGQSYERAFLWLVATQLIFGIGYAWASGRLQIPGRIDLSVISFSLSQIAKPFELLSARQPQGPAYDAILAGAESLPAWSFWTFVHGVISLALIALIILAIRWRFRRE